MEYIMGPSALIFNNNGSPNHMILDNTAVLLRV
jgi:hypothetical protein